MTDQEKAKEQLISELVELRQWVAEWEVADSEHKRVEEEIRQRNRELAALNAIATVVSQSLNLDEILNAALDKVLELMHLDVGGIYLADPVRRKLDLIVHRGISEEFAHEIGSISVDEKTLEAVTAEGKLGRFILSVKAVTKDRVELKRIVSAMKKEGLSLASAVPVLLQAKEEILGLMIVASRVPRRFSEAELQLLTSIGQQIAVAIQNARLFEEAQWRLQELARLSEASQTVTSYLDLEDVLTKIVSLAGMVANSAVTSVVLVEDGELGASFEDFRGIPPLQARARPYGFTRRIIATGEPVVVDEVFEDGATEPPVAGDGGPIKANPEVVKAGIKSLAGLPIMAKEKVLGVLFVRSFQPHAFKDIRLLTTFANQAAIAVENARLFDEERRRTSQLTLINEVGEKAASILDVDRLMPEVTRSIQERFNYYNVALFLLDEECREVVMQAVAGGFEHMAPGEYRQSLDEGIIGFVARTGKSWLARDVSQDPYYVKGFLEEVLTKSELCIPVKLGDKVIGALDVQSIHVNDFDQSDVTAMEAVADRLAIAIENARLFEETRRRLRELESLAQASAAIISTLELHPRLENILDAAMAVVPAAEKGSILLLDEATGELAIQTLIGYSDPRIRSARFPREAGYSAKAVREGRPLLIPDARADPSIRYDGEIEEVRAILSAVVVPLQVKGRIIGVIALDNASRKAAFNEDDLRLLTTFAAQAAIAIENARLYEDIQRELAERKRAEEALRESERKLRLIAENATDVIFAYDMDRRLIYVNPAVKELTGYSVDELRERNFINWLHPEDEARMMKLWEELFEGKGFSEEEFRIVTKDGQVKWGLSSWGPLYDESGRQIGIQGRERDITKRKQAEQLLRARNQAALAMGKALRPEEIFAAVAEELKKLGFACAVFLTDESQKRMFPKYWSYEAGAIKALEKLTGLKMENFPIPIETIEVYRKVIWERKAAFIEDVEDVTQQVLPKLLKKFAGQIVRRLKIPKSISAPLIVEDKVIGMLSVQSDDLTEDDVPAITAFAHQVAAAWRKAQLMQDLERSLIEQEQAQAELQRTLEKLRKALGATIQAMALTVETRDPYTAGHQRGVSNLARAIADEMGLSEEQIDGIRMAGLIHDIGKINVPAEILSKPGRLSDLEFGLIKMHPQAGYDILKTIDIPWPVASIVLQHHERMNGSGYPQGLSGDAIILEARILAVADVVEAMSSHRPYRSARGIDEALEEISQNRGVLYDPEVVDACLRLFTAKGFTF